MIAALFICEYGPYLNKIGIDGWDKVRDARLYQGPFPVIAHPPCERWGRYWSGGPSATVKRKKGDDDGCFESALSSVRRYTGILEHPEASHAFKHFSLPLPDWNGGWTEIDKYGGRSCCVAQGHYGHKARKMTWLYGILPTYPKLKWGPTPPSQRMDQGFHSRKERQRAIKTGICQRLSKRQRLISPDMFAELLISLVLGKLI